MKHQLHKLVGECVDNIWLPDLKIIKDEACGGSHSLPLFTSLEKERETHYCSADVLIVKDNEIQVIIEIDYSNKKPVHVFGKFMVTALSRYYLYESEDEAIGMASSVYFIQILDNSELKEGTKKIIQGKNIEKSIQSSMPINGSKICKYNLIYGNASDFEEGGKKRGELIDNIREFFRNKARI